MGILDKVKDAIPGLTSNRNLDNLINNPTKLLNKINRSLPGLDEKLANLNDMKAKIKAPNETTYLIKEYYIPKSNYMKSLIKLDEQLNDFDKKTIKLIGKLNNRLLNSNLNPPNINNGTLQDHLNTVVATKERAIEERNREINYLTNYIRQISEKTHSHPELGLYEAGLYDYNANIRTQYEELRASLLHQSVPPSYFSVFGQSPVPPYVERGHNTQQANNLQPVQNIQATQGVVPNTPPQAYERSQEGDVNNTLPVPPQNTSRRAINTNPAIEQNNPSPTRSNSQSSH